MRLIRSVLVMLAFFTIVVSVILYLTRVGDAFCLLYDTGDTSTGIFTIHPPGDRRFKHSTAPMGMLHNFNVGVSSYDAKYIMYTAGPKNGPYTLYVDPDPFTWRDGIESCGAGADSVDYCWVGKVPPNPLARPVMSDKSDYWFRWLNNGRLAYEMPLDQEKHTLVIETADGLKKYVFPKEFDATQPFELYHWGGIYVDRYAIVLAPQNNRADVYVWFLEDSRVFTFRSAIPYPADGNLDVSPSGKYLSFVEGQNAIILSAENDEAIKIPLPAEATTASINWSPTERHFIVNYSYWGDGLESNQRLYDFNKLLFDNLGSEGFWSEDGLSYFHTVGATANTTDRKLRDFVKLSVDTGQIDTILENTIFCFCRDLLPDDTLLVEWYEHDTFVLGTVDFQTKAKRVVSRSVNTHLHIMQLDEGKTIAFEVERGKQIDHYTVRLDGKTARLIGKNTIPAEPETIYNITHGIRVVPRNNKFAIERMDFVTGIYQTITSGLDSIDIDSVDRWQNGRSDRQFRPRELYHDDLITFVGIRNNKKTVEMIRLPEGRHYILASGLAQANPTFSTELNAVLFGWIASEGQQGVDAYTLDNKLIFHVEYDIHALESNGFYNTFFVSPDGKTLAFLATVSKDAPKLYFAATDGSWTKLIRPALSADRSLGWSPDGKQFAFVNSNNQGYSVEIVDEVGDDLYRIDGFVNEGYLRWNECG